MKYRVIESFSDLKDHNYSYAVGDIFPRSGYIASAKRLEELSGTNNRRGRAVIQAVEEFKPIPVQVKEAEKLPPKKRKRAKNDIRNLS